MAEVQNDLLHNYQIKNPEFLKNFNRLLMCIEKEFKRSFYYDTIKNCVCWALGSLK